MVGFCVGFGCLSGVFFTLTQAVVVEYVGLQRFPLAFGFIQLFNGLSAALAYPITGRRPCVGQVRVAVKRECNATPNKLL